MSGIRELKNEACIWFKKRKSIRVWANRETLTFAVVTLVSRFSVPFSAASQIFGKNIGYKRSSNASVQPGVLDTCSQKSSYLEYGMSQLVGQMRFRDLC